MARKPTPESIKAAADRAAKRSAGDVDASAPKPKTERKSKGMPQREKTRASAAKSVLLTPKAPPDAPTEGVDKGGRPTKYQAANAKKAQLMCERGATDADLADFFKVTTRTIQNWSASHPEFFLALKAGKASADDRVERSLYQKAVGFEHDAVKIMQYEGKPVIVPYREKVAPDTTACIFWLKNRRKDDWRDKHELEHGANDDFKALWTLLSSGKVPA